MQDLKIGAHVVCCAVTSLIYDDKDNRIALDERCLPFNGIIVGRALKQLGQYNSGSRSFDGEDYDPPYLSITGTVQLWEVRTGWRNRPVLVRDENLKPCAVFDLPTQTKRPTVEVAA